MTISRISRVEVAAAGPLDEGQRSKSIAVLDGDS